MSRLTIHLMLLLSASAIGGEPELEQCLSLLADPAFAEGFGAAFSYGRRADDGVIRSYRDIRPWQVQLIPEGPVMRLPEFKKHPWDFQEGYHDNYINPRGEKVRELHTHRLVVNHRIEVNTAEKLQFAQFNNDGLGKDDPQRDTKLVKRVTTDRRGTLRLFYNSQNEIRNAATAHSSRWARDTWPHFLVNQRFEHPVPISSYERLDFSVSFRVDSMKQLSPWPGNIKGAAKPSMNLNFMFQLRERDDPSQKLFVGMMLFTSSEAKYTPHLGIEQHGMIFCRESVTRDQTRPLLGESRTVNRDIKDMITSALREAHEKKPELSSDPEDYLLMNFSIGWEGMGYWQTKSEISGLSLTGQPRVTLEPGPAATAP
jgi:hypothetical protein